MSKSRSVRIESVSGCRIGEAPTGSTSVREWPGKLIILVRKSRPIRIWRRSSAELVSIGEIALVVKLTVVLIVVIISIGIRPRKSIIVELRSVRLEWISGRVVGPSSGPVRKRVRVLGVRKRVFETIVGSPFAELSEELSKVRRIVECVGKKPEFAAIKTEFTLSIRTERIGEVVVHVEERIAGQKIASYAHNAMVCGAALDWLSHLHVIRSNLVHLRLDHLICLHRFGLEVVSWLDYRPVLLAGVHGHL